MNLDALGRIVWEQRRPPRGLEAGQAAIVALPEVSDGLPALTDGDRGWGIQSACGDALETPVRRLFEAALREAEARVGGTVLPDGDPLVEVLRAMVAEGLGVSAGAGVVPLLEVVRQTSALLSAPPGELSPRLAPIRALPPAEQGELLGRLAGRIQVRLAAVLAALATSGLRVPALAQSVVGSRFALLFERAALDPEASLSLLAAVHGSGIPTATVVAGTIALRTALASILDRRSAGRGTPEDLGFALRYLPPDLADRGAADVARAILTDADAVAWLLPQLSRFTDVKSLTRAGIAAPLAKDLLRPEQGLALASAIGEVLRELRRWDVLSALAASLTPVTETHGRADRALVVPHGVVHAVVVAVGLGRIRRPRAGADAIARVDRHWAEAMRGAHGCVHVDLGHCALVAFLDALAAFRFALRIGQHFTGDPPAVGVGVGEISGGTDGEVVQLGGPAVESALQWLSLGPLPPRGGMDGIQALGLHGGRLCGQGVGIDGAAADAVEGARHAAGLVGPRDAAPGGDARMPRSLDTLRVFEFDDEVIALVRVGGVSGGVEAVRFSLSDWVALLDRDSAAAMPHSAPVAAVQRQTAVRGFGPRAAALDRIEMPAPDASFDRPITVIEGQAATPPPPFDPFAMDAPAPVGPPAAASDPFSSFDDPFASNTEASRSMVLDVGPRDAFGPAPVPDEPAVRHEVLAASGWDSGWSPPPTPAPTPDVQGSDELRLARKPRDSDPGDFTSFFLPGVQPAAKVDPTVDVDIEDDPSVSSHTGRARSEPPLGEVEPGIAVFEPRPKGFKTERGGANGEGELAPRRPRMAGDTPTMDFEFLLKGYCAFIDGGQMVFGRPYGARIVDRHAYAYYGDVDDAYCAFLKDKIAEGFAPRTELVGDLPRGTTLAPLESDRLTKAWRVLS